MPTELYAAEGFKLTLEIPSSARELGSEELPRPDVSRLPGASVVALRGWDGEAVLRAGCVRGPSSRFAPGIEEVLFEKATWLTLTRVGIEPSALQLTRAKNDERQFERVLHGRQGDDTIRLQHLIVFAGEDRDVILCTTLCRGAPAACEAGVGALAVEGVSAPLPRPSLLARSALWAASDPTTALAVAAGAAALLLAVVLWRRPYPRP